MGIGARFTERRPRICLAKHVTDGVAHVLAIRLVQPSGAAAALGEEHEIHDQKRNRPSDCVIASHFFPLRPYPVVLFSAMTPPIQSGSGYPLSVYSGVDGAGSSSHRGAPPTLCDACTRDGGFELPKPGPGMSGSARPTGSALLECDGDLARLAAALDRARRWRQLRCRRRPRRDGQDSGTHGVSSDRRRSWHARPAGTGCGAGAGVRVRRRQATLRAGTRECFGRRARGSAEGCGGPQREPSVCQAHRAERSKSPARGPIGRSRCCTACTGCVRTWLRAIRCTSWSTMPTWSTRHRCVTLLSCSPAGGAPGGARSLPERGRPLPVGGCSTRSRATRRPRSGSAAYHAPRPDFQEALGALPNRSSSTRAYEQHGARRSCCTNSPERYATRASNRRPGRPRTSIASEPTRSVARFRCA